MPPFWGTRIYQQTPSTGLFDCPRCRARRVYAYRRLVRYVALYGVPLFPTQTVAEYVMCAACQRTCDPAVLEAQPAPAAG